MRFNLTFIDLFAGCGGLSEGFYKQGFKPFAHLEHDHFSCESLKMSMKHYGFLNTNSNIIEKDIRDKKIMKKKLDKMEWDCIYEVRRECKKKKWHNINGKVQE